MVLKRSMELFCAFLLIFLIGCATENQTQHVTRFDVVIENVNIVDVKSGAIIPNQTVSIVNDTIVSTAPLTEGHFAPQKIDGSGKYLIPGLWDMHIHTSTDAINRNAIYPLLIANGVTGARSMAGDCHLEDGDCGEPLPTIYELKKTQQEIAAGSLVGPRLIASSYYTNGPSSLDKSTIADPGTAKHAREYTRLLHSRGVDLIKIYSDMYREAYFAIADEAQKLDLEFAGHVPLTLKVSEASDAGQSSIEHITGFLEQCSTAEDELRPAIRTAYHNPADFFSILIKLAKTFDEQKCQQVYEHLARNKTWLVPTLNVERYYEKTKIPSGDWRDDPNIKYVPHIEFELWERTEEWYYGEIPDYKKVMQPHFEKSFQITGAAHNASVPMMAGSDAGEYGIIWGFTLHKELQYMVEAGLTELDALQAATLNPAKYRRQEDRLGTIETGKLADLVLLDANPLENIANTQKINMVIANGRVFHREVLDALLNSVEDYAKSTRK